MTRTKKSKLLSFLLCFVMVATAFGQIPMIASATETGSDGLQIQQEGEDIDNLTLQKDEKCEIEVAGASGDVQWQYYAEDYEMWISIYGETSAKCTLTYAKVCNMLDDNDQTKIRCTQQDGDTTVKSNEVTLTVKEAQDEVAAPSRFSLRSAAPMVLSEGSADVDEADGAAPQNDDPETYNVVINYVFENNEIAADPYTANLAAGSSFSVTVNFPEVQGYLPYVGEVQQNSIDLNYESISSDDIITVVYKPTNVDYTVIHYQQNLNDDNYTEVVRETKQGLTNSTVPEVAKSYEGFYALLYEKPAIAADGSTVVEVYYDRYYYLMNFDLDGGYGVEPIYARYGSPIGDVGTPTKAGYSFEGWYSDPDKTNKVASLPSTMPASNKTYYAKWMEADTSFTVVYWLENPDDNNYSYWGSKSVAAMSDKTIGTISSADYKIDDYSSTAGTVSKSKYEYELKYSSYNRKKTESQGTIEVAGDGSTVLNIYYDRNVYTLKFYYAMSKNNNYYVVGGSSYGFGASADAGVKTDNVIALLDQYATGNWRNQVGKVDEVPQLNGTGENRNYTTGSTTSKSSGYTYYFISFDAKYGADISEKWPCAVFNSVTRVDKNNVNGWSGTEAFVSAWNGEHHVYYSQHNENQTIKGNYNKLDYQLLWDHEKFEDSDIVAYLCFWENGANIDWSVPELYRYKIYVPVLEGQDTTGLTTVTKNGVTYYLRNTYDTCDDSDVEHQTAPAIQGLTYSGTYDHTDWTYSMTAEEKKLYKEAYDVNFYYSRNVYNLNFTNVDNPCLTKELKYEMPLDSYKDYVPDYPSNYEPGAYEFAGWYQSPTCAEGTEFEFDGKTMPSNDINLYAKWVPVNHKVEFYLDKNAFDAGTKLSTHSDITVPHGTKADPTPADPTNGSYTFVGWFYMENGQEKAFDFANMPVNKDLQVYGKWSSNVLKNYTVYYKIQGTDIEIAAPTTGSGLAGITKTFEAKGGSDLYTAYQEGYFPVSKSHSLTIDIDDETKNVYTFWYVQADKVPYTVKYLNKETGASVAEDKNVDDNTKAVVTETFVQVSGMMPDAYQKRLVVSAEEGAVNEIIFYYTEDTTHAYYKITHYTENLAKDAQGNTTWTEYASSQAVGDIGTTYTADPMTIPGFTYDSTVSGTVTSGKLTANGLELKLYYTRNSYPYQVRYLEQGTGNQLDVPKNGTGKYGQVISESAIDITDYEAVDPKSQTLNIRIEEDNVAKLNIINFYYQEREVTINYEVVGPDGCGTVSPTSETLKILSGTAQGSTPTANENFRFVGWYTDAACTTSVDSSLVYENNKLIPAKQSGKNIAATYYAKFEYKTADLTIKKSGIEAVDHDEDYSNDITGEKESQSTIFRITGGPDGNYSQDIVVCGNSQVTITGLKVGTYKVTEMTGWSWRYTPDAAEKEVILTEAGAIVEFKNRRDAIQWLNGGTYKDNGFSN